jgi:cold shock CspA family protein
MPTGRINWFGGLNTKTNKLNNYGFIEPTNSDLQENIFVNRIDISQELQEIIEGKNGEGVYVEFEIREDIQAKKRAVNLKLYELLGIVEWFNEGRGYVQCENRPDVRISSNNLMENQQNNINSGDIVLFVLRYNNRYQKDEGFLVRKIDKNNQEEEIINKCFHSSIPKIFIQFISKYLDYFQLSTSAKIKLIEDKIDSVDNHKEKSLVAKEIGIKNIDVYISSLLIRDLLNIDDYLLFLESYFNSYHEDLLFQENVTNFILEKLKSLDSVSNRKKLLNPLLEKYPSIFLVNNDLRQWLTSENCDIQKYCQFINNALKNIDEEEAKKDLLREIFEYIKQSDENKRIILWDEISEFTKYLKYRNKLWNFAPKQYQQKIIKLKFKRFFQIQEKFANSCYPYAENITANITDLFPLDYDSQKLIEKWDNEVNQNIHKAAQMMSARGAEQLVIKYVKEMGYKVEDISIHQVTGKSKDWIQGDIKINDQILLDVKNARTNINSSSYSEFCVPRFKNNRGENVIVIAVLSPYLQHKYLVEYKLSKQLYKFEKVSELMLKVTETEFKPKPSHNPQNKNHSLEKKEYSFKIFAPTILGSFQKSELKKLENYFSEHLISINMKRDNNINNYLPPWLFDYGKDFYCEQIKSVEEFKQLFSDDIPSGEDIEILEKECTNFIPLLICSKSKLPQSWLKKIPKWQIDFIHYLVKLPTHRITLPYVFLSILVHFLKMLSHETEIYQPIEYLKILQGLSSEELASLKSRQLSGFTDMIHPLKIYDPLNTIESFCFSLQSIWETREKAQLNEFKIFKFNGQGLLTAQRFEGESPITLLAYCGGWIEKKGKCGYKPLVIGKHQNCPICGRLICPKDDCQYCSDQCRGYEQRKRERKKESESNHKDNKEEEKPPF